MARVVIKRGADTAGIVSRIHVTIDGVLAASLLPLQSKGVTLDAGVYQVVGNISWAQSRTLELRVAEDDTVTLRVKAPWSAVRKALKSLDDVRNADIQDSILIEESDRRKR
jgi:hypothetical protein